MTSHKRIDHARTQSASAGAAARAVRTVIRIALVAALTTLAAIGTSAVCAPSAQAAPLAPISARLVLKVAAAQQGKPYRHGSAGPTAFDCSGFVKFVMARNHRTMRRTAAQQYQQVRHIPKSQVRPGDLIFFFAHGRIYHVGIYAGGGYIWHAPKPGDRVKKAKIWTTAWKAGRMP